VSQRRSARGAGRGLGAPLALGLDVEAEVELAAAAPALQVDAVRDQVAAGDPARFLDRDPPGVEAQRSSSAYSAAARCAVAGSGASLIRSAVRARSMVSIVEPV